MGWGRRELRFLNSIEAEERRRWTVGLATDLAERVGVEPTGSSFLSVPVGVPPHELRRKFAEADVVAAIRQAEVRISFHVYNTPADVDTVVNALAPML